MDKIQFVDVNLHQISVNECKTKRFAIDLGVRSCFAKKMLPKENCHFFVSTEPWVKNVDKKGAYAFLSKLMQLNPQVVFDLLELEQVEKLNGLGYSVDFEIRNCWTCSTCSDWHGRIDGYYSMLNGRLVVDWGQNKTDVYVIFGFVSGYEKAIVLPE